MLVRFRPAIGGAFTNPAERWPGLFGQDGFFANYPYFLPCVVAALVPVSAFLLASIALKEVYLIQCISEY